MYSVFIKKVEDGTSTTLVDLSIDADGAGDLLFIAAEPTSPGKHQCKGLIAARAHKIADAMVQTAPEFAKPLAQSITFLLAEKEILNDDVIGKLVLDLLALRLRGANQ